MKNFKIGIMGTGRGMDIAENLMLLGCEIVAICEFDKKRAERGSENSANMLTIAFRMLSSYFSKS